MAEIDEVIIIVSLLCEEEERSEKTRKQQKIWIHDIPNSRYEKGEYHTLLPRLKKAPKRFHTHFRMSQHKGLVELMQPHIESSDTLFRRAIGVEEKLMVTIR
nr:unnamed protein product [Callosobruchus chinensis]